MNGKGFTLIEVLVVISIIGIFASMAVPVNNHLYHRTLLENTANEMKSALYLAQQMSLDESREYGFEVYKDIFRIREHKLRGDVVYVREINPRIKVVAGKGKNVIFNRHGETAYRLFILENKQGNTIKIEVMIGTGRVRMTKDY